MDKKIDFKNKIKQTPRQKGRRNVGKEGYGLCGRVFWLSSNSDFSFFRYMTWLHFSRCLAVGCHPVINRFISNAMDWKYYMPTSRPKFSDLLILPLLLLRADSEDDIYALEKELLTLN